MLSVTAPLPLRGGRLPPEAAGLEAASLAIVAGLACVVLFLLLNPFLALFAVAIISLFRRVAPLTVILPGAPAFAVFFYSREYGIEWYRAGSTDDVPQYISMYNTDFGLSFSDLFGRFLEVPSGNEPLWHLPWWVLANTLDASDGTFVFLHYLLIFLSLFIALWTISGRHLAPLALVYFLLIPLSIDGVAHIWRQQLAAFVFLAGAGLYIVRGLRLGKWLIFVTPLLHLSSLFFIAFFMVYRLLSRLRMFDDKAKMMVVLTLILMTVPALASAAVVFLDSLGLPKIMGYFEGYGVDQLRIYLLIGAYAVPQLLAYWLLRCDQFNHLVLVLCFAVFSIVLAIPAANSIYDRLLMFTLPLLSIYMYRSLMQSFSVVWRLPVLAIVFAIGVSRLHAPTAVGDGPGSYLAYGHAFDPTMGLLKMLTSL